MIPWKFLFTLQYILLHQHTLTACHSDNNEEDDPVEDHQLQFDDVDDKALEGNREDEQSTLLGDNVLEHPQGQA